MYMQREGLLLHLSGGDVKRKERSEVGICEKERKGLAQK